ncbi:MAG: flavin reductase family protein, partial [Planctomycetota bacterium]
MNLVTLCQLSYGMYVVASVKDGKFNGQVANTVFQVTSEPPTIAVSIHQDNLTHEYIQSSRVFTVSILTEEAPIKFIGLFGFKSGRQVDKFKETKYKIGVTGAPIVLDYTSGYLEAEVINQVDAGTHTIFIGRVV